MPDFKVPTSEEFRRALEALEENLPENYLNMLKIHHAAHDHTISATGLAHAVGYKNYSAANLHYGKLAALLVSELNFDIEDWIFLKLLVEFIMPGKQGNTEILWVMRPEVAEALKALGWV